MDRWRLREGGREGGKEIDFKKVEGGSEEKGGGNQISNKAV